MNNDELIAQICIRIGMIMEDVCGDAVTVRADGGGQLGAVVARLVQTARMLADSD